MKKAVSIITLVDMLFILALSFFSSFGEPISALLRILFVVLVTFVVFRVSLEMREERERVAGVAEKRVYLWRMKREDVPLFLSSVMPTVAVIFLISFLTSLLLSLVGATSPEVTERPLPEMLLINCFLPTVVEELIFRYVPMKLMAPYSPRWCIIISSLFFALAHLSLFQIPYALFAGAIFMVLNLMTESIIPSLVLHFLNNTISVLWIKYSDEPTFALVFLIVLVLSALISLIPLLRIIKRRGAELKALFTEGEPFVVTFAPVAFIVFTLVLTISSLF